jgi:phosphate transport system permease protein
MERKKSFTGRQRRLTNRWGVKLSDSLARALITVGGIGTIAAVLMVFLFLAYVALPLFLPTTLAHAKIDQRPEPEVPLLFDVDENLVLTWQLFGDGRFRVARFGTGKVVRETTLFAGQKVRSAASFPEDSDFAVGLANGTVVLGNFDEKVKLRRPADLPPAIIDLSIGESVEFEKGILQRTPQGQYRWQAIDVQTNAPIEFSDSPIVHVDFQRVSDTDLSLVAVSESGEVTVAGITETTNLLTGEKKIETAQRKVSLPNTQPAPPWRAYLMGRANQLLVLWRNGHVARYRLPSGGDPVMEEERALVEDGELTAAMMLQGRYTLLVGDSQGRLSAWFTAATQAALGEQVRLLKAHDLPPLDGAVTSLSRSRTIRLVAAGSSTGQVKLYFVTSDRQLLSTRPFKQSPVEKIVLSPNDDALLALSGDQAWRAALTPRHPEASWASLFRPVWYEGYDRPMHKWQSSAGNQEPEPKYGLMPLIFGTLKATFYSLLFGVPIAILAAVYTSEFVDRKVKAPIKSLIELMASVPSVVLGFLAGLVFAPFVEDVLPTLLASFFCIPFMFLLGAQLWQQLPQKTGLRLAKYRLAGIGLMLVIGVALSMYAGPHVQNWLFAGDFKAWLNRQRGTGTGGWFLLLLPLAAVVASLLMNAYLNPWLRQRFGSLQRGAFALLNLGKFLLVSILAVVLAYALGAGLTAAGIDSRGGLVDTYVQRNALVVGFVMGFAIIPIIYTISEDALSTVPKHLRSASLGCGATPWQTTWRVVVPTAASGLFSAVMVGMGRAVGETMIVLMATGNVPIMELNIFNGFRSLSANIAEELPEAPPWSTHFRILFLTGLTLLVITFLINTAAEAIRISFRRRASQL